MREYKNIILLVDDDEDDHIIFQEALSSLEQEYQLMLTADGKEAFNLLETMEQLPSYIFLDINMPVMDGFECLSLITQNKKYSSIKIVMYSTSDDVKTKNKAIAEGANYFLTKPSVYTELQDSLKEILG